MDGRAASASFELAVVLRSDAFGEADRIVTLFTARHGKLRAIARRARSSRRRFAGLQACVLGTVRVEHKPSQALHVLHEFAVEEGQVALLSDLGRLSHAAYFCELTDVLSPPEAHEPRLFTLLCEVLRELHREPANVERLRRFEARALEILGFLPAIDACVQCSKKIADAAGWSATGLLCDECAPEPQAIALQPLWALFAEERPSVLGHGPWRAILQTWMRGPLGGRSLRTIAFIEEINR